MTVYESTRSVLGRARSAENMGMTEPEARRVIVLTLGRDARDMLKTMCAALDIAVEVVVSHHDLPFRLHQHRPMAVISELDPRGLASCSALRGIAAYDADMPILLTTHNDPAIHGTVDALEQLWGLTALRRVDAEPQPQELITFLYEAGQQSGLGRLMPVA